MAGNFDGIKTRNFGIEIEMTGITRCAAAKAIGKALGTSPHHAGGYYDVYEIDDSEGRTWQIVCDSSIYARKKQHYARYLKKHMTQSELREWADYAFILRDKAYRGYLSFEKYEELL